MADKELADRVVALGIPTWNQINGRYGALTDERRSEYLRDWRVAGKLMEKCDIIECRCVAWLNRDPGAGWDVNIGDSWNPVNGNPLPRAIIEACVEDLENG